MCKKGTIEKKKKKKKIRMKMNRKKYSAVALLTLLLGCSQTHLYVRKYILLLPLHAHIHTKSS